MDVKDSRPVECHIDRYHLVVLQLRVMSSRYVTTLSRSMHVLQKRLASLNYIRRWIPIYPIIANFIKPLVVTAMRQMCQTRQVCSRRTRVPVETVNSVVLIISFVLLIWVVRMFLAC